MLPFSHLLFFACWSEVRCHINFTNHTALEMWRFGTISILFLQELCLVQTQRNPEAKQTRCFLPFVAQTSQTCADLQLTGNLLTIHNEEGTRRKC